MCELKHIKQNLQKRKVLRKDALIAGARTAPLLHSSWKAVSFSSSATLDWADTYPLAGASSSFFSFFPETLVFAFTARASSSFLPLEPETSDLLNCKETPEPRPLSFELRFLFPFL